MSTFKSNSNSLEALVRLALFNGELAPGVAEQINSYREGLLPRDEKRLLTILDDAITDGFVTVIETITQTTTVRQTVSHTVIAPKSPESIKMRKNSPTGSSMVPSYLN